MCKYCLQVEVGVLAILTTDSMQGDADCESRRQEASASPCADASEASQRGDGGAEGAVGSESRGHPGGGVEEESNTEPGTQARRGRPEKSGAGRGHKKGEIRNLVCDLPTDLKRDLEGSASVRTGTDADRDEEVRSRPLLVQCCDGDTVIVRRRRRSYGALCDQI